MVAGQKGGRLKYISRRKTPALQAGLWGKVQEIRDAVLDFKESGKPIVAYLEYGSGQQYYLATAADEVYLTPTSPLDLVGVASYDLFLRGALTRNQVNSDASGIRVGGSLPALLYNSPGQPFRVPHTDCGDCKGRRKPLQGTGNRRLCASRAH